MDRPQIATMREHELAFVCVYTPHWSALQRMIARLIPTRRVNETTYRIRNSNNIFHFCRHIAPTIYVSVAVRTQFCFRGLRRSGLCVCVCPVPAESVFLVSACPAPAQSPENYDFLPKIYKTKHEPAAAQHTQQRTEVEMERERERKRDWGGNRGMHSRKVWYK